MAPRKTKASSSSGTVTGPSMAKRRRVQPPTKPPTTREASSQRAARGRGRKQTTTRASPPPSVNHLQDTVEIGIDNPTSRRLSSSAASSSTIWTTGRRPADALPNTTTTTAQIQGEAAARRERSPTVSVSNIRRESESSLIARDSAVNIINTNATTPMANDVNREFVVARGLGNYINETPNNSVANAIMEMARAVRDVASENGSQAGNRLFKKDKLPEFDGNVLEFNHFRESYRESQGHFTTRENIGRLFKALKGEARKTVDIVLGSTNDPEKILMTLGRFYGGKNKIGASLLNDINGLPDLETGNLNIAQFAAKLGNAVEALISYKLTGHLHSPELLKNVASKLPTAIRYSYHEYAATSGEDKADLQKLAEFLNLKAELALSSGMLDLETMPSTSQSQEKTTKQTRPVRTAVVCATVEESRTNNRNADPESYVRCMHCDKFGHKIEKCQEFCNESVKKKYAILKKLGLCYRCLKKGHMRSQCKVKIVCNLCKKNHHTSWHRDENKEGNEQSANRSMPHDAGSQEQHSHETRRD